MQVQAAVALVMSALISGEAGLSVPPPPDEAYRHEIDAHRAEREKRLRAEDGWLALVGLSWLEPGDNPFGSDPGNRVVLPPGLPPSAGSLIYEDGTVRLLALPAVEITLDGHRVQDQILRDDAEGKPDLLRLGRISFHVIKRGERHAVRIKDLESPARKTFTALDYFPLDPAYRLRASFKAFSEPRRVTIPTVLGTELTLHAPGSIEFSIGGRNHSLLALVEDPAERELWFIFRDATSGRETYGAGRYLYADLADDGSVILDFNKAFNPPCAFTSFATCPLPPLENRLGIPIPAGEKLYSLAHE